MSLSSMTSLLPRRESTTFAFLLFGSVILLVSANQRFSMLPAAASVLTKRLRSLSPPASPKSASSQTTGELIVYSQNHHEAWRRKPSLTGHECDDLSCEVEVINELQDPVLLCWIDEQGRLKGFRPVNDKSIKDNSVSNKHVEYTYVNHAFLCIKSSETSSLPKRLQDVSEDQFIFHFTAKQGRSRHSITLSVKDSSTVMKLRGSRNKQHITTSYACRKQSNDDHEVVDSTKKHYDVLFMEGFQVKYEPGVFQEVPALEQCLSEDLKVLVRLLPPRACAKLQRDTTIWLNKSITFGKKSNPIIGKSCTFHPLGGAAWLKNNGLSVEKEGCVEISCAEEYLKSRNHWGIGGILVHEFSHAYHNKCCKKGFECDEILTAYQTAMQKKLYHAVKVHGPQGEKGLAKAYACTNCMEFFAELSVAYLWCEDDSEYNKWYPHNRQQLLEYDPITYQVLEKQWLQYE